MTADAFAAHWWFTFACIWGAIGMLYAAAYERQLRLPLAVAA